MSVCDGRPVQILHRQSYDSGYEHGEYFVIQIQDGLVVLHHMFKRHFNIDHPLVRVIHQIQPTEDEAMAWKHVGQCKTTTVYNLGTVLRVIYRCSYNNSSVANHTKC